MKIRNKWVYTATFACAAAGLILPFWPLTVLGVVMAVLYGRVVYGLCLALIFDLILGVPTGILYWVHFPLFVLALFCFLLRYLALRYMLERGSPGRL